VGTTFIGENEDISVSRTDSPQKSAVSICKVKFPHKVPFRKLTATIYGKSAAYPFYRMAVNVAGKRVVRSFQNFAAAKKDAEAKLRQMAKGKVAAGLSAKESADAIAIRQALAAYQQETGRQLSALEAVTSYITAAKVLPDNCTMPDANHRLLEADGLRKEDADTGEVDYYRPAELRLMLDKAAPQMAVIIALQAVGGFRLQEGLRLTWGDVWRVPGKVEISSAKAKWRSRRLVEINSTLAARGLKTIARMKAQ